MAEDLTPRGVLRGLLSSPAWWCWVGYAWLGNVVQADEGVGRIAMFGAMAAMFVMALAVPESFDDFDGGLSGPVVLAFSYLAVRLLHLAIFWMAAGEGNDYALRGQLLRFAPSVLGSTALLAVPAPRPRPTLTGGAVSSSDYAARSWPARGWRLTQRPIRRAARLIVYRAGESISAIWGSAWPPSRFVPVIASSVRLILEGSLWWAYFTCRMVAERALRAAAVGPRRIAPTRTLPALR